MSSAPQDKADPTPTAPHVAGGEPAAPVEASEILVRYSGRTAVGLVREHNEDNFVIANLDAGETSPADQVCHDRIGPTGMLFAVCDGMGGAAAGEVASQMAVDVLLEALRRGGAPEARDDLARRLVGAVQEAGKRIYNEAQKERTKRGMGTTATVAVLLDKILFVAEVGDSRAYLLRGGELRQLTKDQSLVNQLIEAGHLTEEEAEGFEHSNIILQALGTSDSVQVDLTFVELRRGDRLMLCSDGLSGLVHDESIRDALAEVDDPAECTSLLVEYAEGGGGHDNITVIVADFDGEGLSYPKASDSFGYMQYPLLPDEGTAPQVMGESLRPARGDSVRATSSRAPGSSGGAAWPWLFGGLVALGAGAALMFLSPNPEVADPRAAGVGAAKVLEPARPDELAATAPATEAPGITPAEVEVRVHTDVEHARLIVNGDAYGPLSADESYPLKLRPGAYRLEAETDGNISAVQVVTVRADNPMDVYLELPRGTQAGEAVDASAVVENDEFGEEDPDALGADDDGLGIVEIGVGMAEVAVDEEAAPTQNPVRTASAGAESALSVDESAQEKPSEGAKSAKARVGSEPDDAQERRQRRVRAAAERKAAAPARARSRTRSGAQRSGASSSSDSATESEPILSVSKEKAEAQPKAEQPKELPDNPY